MKFGGCWGRLGLGLVGGMVGALGRADSEELSLAEILNLKTTVSSQTPLAARESPGIVSIITADDIQAMGARDLREVLARVPGFQFGLDVQGVTGIAVRGQWAHEGKALVIWDGHEFNEPLYSIVPFGHHFPVDQISVIEIIRGPGSAIYGGNAELAVIKVTTKSAQELAGAEGRVGYGQMSRGYAERDLSLQAGEKWDDWRVKASAYVGQGRRSNRSLTAFGETYDMLDAHRLDPQQASLQINYRAAELAFLFDRYGTSYRDGYDRVLPRPVDLIFHSAMSRAKYDWQPSERLKLTPSLSYGDYRPWNSSDANAKTIAALDPPDYPYDSIYWDKRVIRLRGGITAQYAFTETLNLVTGVDRTEDRARDRRGEFGATGTDRVRYGNWAAYSQGIWRTPLVNLTLGARFERHSAYGNSFVPRVGLTRVLGDLHLKALASGAFRAPSIVNIDANPGIKPERTQVYEFEAGYQFTPETILTVNVFEARIAQPIVYSVVDGADFYANGSRSGSRGFEVEYRLRQRSFQAQLGYSYYRARNDVPSYRVSDEVSGSVLGLANHKATVQAQYKCTRLLSLSSSLDYLGPRYGYATAAADGPSKLKSVYLANLYAQYRDWFLPHLNLGMGLYNLLDQDFRYVQTYSTPDTEPHPPLPGLPREFAVNLSYSLPW